MSQLIPLVDILREKKGALKEAHLILFEYCNLRCSFCHQDHDSKLGFDTVMEKVETLLRNTAPSDHYIVNMTGGELFVDDISNELFEVYYQAGKRVLDYYDDVILSFGTNLVYENVNRVESLVLRLKEHGRVTIATSYDPAGRFSADDEELFFKNLNILKEHIDTVNVVITKQNVQTFLKGKESEKFTYLCDNFNVYFDHYIPSALYNQHQPDEDNIGDLYLLLNEKYPNSYPLKSWRENSFNGTTCKSTKIVNKDNVVTTCWSEAGRDSILDEGDGLQAKDEAELNFLEHYDCFSCEYYSRCGLRCFLHHSFIGNKSKVCRIKSLFDVIVKQA